MSCDRSMRWMSVCLVALLTAPGGCFDFASRLPPPPTDTLADATDSDATDLGGDIADAGLPDGPAGPPVVFVTSKLYVPHELTPELAAALTVTAGVLYWLEGRGDAPERAAAIQPLVGPGLVGGRLQARF